MKSSRLVLTILAILATATVAGAEISPPEADGPFKVTVLVYVLDIDAIDSSQQSFTANVYLEASWHDPRLARPGTAMVFKGLNEIWQPHLQILNQQKLWKTFADRLEVDPEGNVLYRQRFWGNFSQPMDLRNYPLDRQSLTIQIVAAGNTPDKLRLVPASHTTSLIARKLSVPDFTVTGTEASSGVYHPAGLARGVASFTTVVHVKRRSGYFVVKVIVPLVLIVMMSWAVFWIDPSESGTQIGVATTTMLTLIAFRFAVDANLPKISYLTRLDTFIMASTVLVFLSLFEVVITSRLAKVGRHERALRMDRVSRFLFPTAFAGVVIFTLVV